MPMQAACRDQGSVTDGIAHWQRICFILRPNRADGVLRVGFGCKDAKKDEVYDDLERRCHCDSLRSIRVT